MALPLLFNGADCGPVNPLQSLGKRFDQDRGVQQDHFGAGRAGSSREAFRTQTSAAPGFAQDAARFFSAGPAQASGMPAFDLSALHKSLSAQQPLTPTNFKPAPVLTASSWASDFMHQSPSVASPAIASHMVQSQAPQMQSQSQPMDVQSNARAWSPLVSGYQINAMPSFSSTFAPQPQNLALQPNSTISWDNEFQSLEQSLATVPLSQTQESQQQNMASRPQADDELARTAALLIDAVQHEQNPKFKASQFMGLMRQLRDGDVTVEGDRVVERGPGAVDLKGKGKTRDSGFAPAPPPLNAGAFARDFLAQQSQQQQQQPALADADAVLQEDENDAYFRQENEEYVRYFDELVNGPRESAARGSAQSTEWDHLQHDWDRFEATATGIRPVGDYHFQTNNPYMHGEASRTRHHAMHSGTRQAFLESVLELEAAVQRDPSNSEAWFELGVKQQENEREQKAIAALTRSLALDPSHLPSWLALAVSHTNEGARSAAYDAIHEWASRNPRYAQLVASWKAATPDTETQSQGERFGGMIRCLIGLATSGGADGELDADVQIAMAVMLNINEEWEKSGDCFRTALAVRPDDWLLWNRVGATLANNGHPDDALQYYNRAIELNPVYIRARYNGGIALINLRRYDEAAGQLLDALVLQESDGTRSPDGREDNGRITSSSLWDSLKSACMHMRRIDLSTICDRRDLDAFRTAFEGPAPAE